MPCVLLFGNADPTPWFIALAQRVSQVVRVTVGTWVDYFKPISGVNLCGMLTAYNLHTWAATEEGPYGQPLYVEELSTCAACSTLLRVATHSVTRAYPAVPPVGTIRVRSVDQQTLAGAQGTSTCTGRRVLRDAMLTRRRLAALLQYEAEGVILGK